MPKRRFNFEPLEPRWLLAANPIITEFMASNDGVLEDGSGVSPDWIELHNAGDQSVDLTGYRLTDDASDDSKWLFPSVQLGAGEFLTVFASGEDMPDSAGNLHTNFSLSVDGEYLALVSPSGAILSQYGTTLADYPPQSTDVSYGLAMDYAVTEVVTPSSSVHYLIPTNPSVDATWTAPGFNDAAWTAGTASLGYENTPADYQDLIDTAVPTGTSSAYVRIHFEIDDANARLDTLRLNYDDGFVAYINGVRVASANAPAGLDYSSIATADHPDTLAVEAVEFDLGDAAASLNVGQNTLAIHLLNRSPSSDLLMIPTLVVSSGGVIKPPTEGYLAAPTPGQPNTNLRGSEVHLSRQAGVFNANFTLAMSAAGGEEIRYTTDGSNPHAASPLYTSALSITTTQQVRARSLGPAGEIGPIVGATYVKASNAVASVTSDLPILVLDNLGGGVPDRDFQDSTFALYDVDPATGLSSLANPADLTSLSGQHRRGRSTFGQPKLNLRLELRDVFGEDQNQSLLGLPSESDWVLYAPWTIDRAMVRHSLIYDLGRQTGTWAPRTRFVEVYSNFDGGDLTESDYVGAYVLMESVKRDGDRVDIAELTPSQNSGSELTGGYIFQANTTDPGDVAWDTQRGFPQGPSEYIHVEPGGDELTQAQIDYIRGYVDDFEDALYGPNFTDPEVGFRAYLDIEAAIDFHLLNTFAANPDAFRLSAYMTKDRDSKLAFGPLWDFDRGMGPDLDDRAADPTVWMSDQEYLWVTQYWRRLYEDADFEQLWVDRWQELRETVFSDANLASTLRAQTDQLAGAQARNAARWGPGIAPNGGPLSTEGGGWAGEVSHLENWLLERAAWIDTQTIARPAITPDAGNVTAGDLVTLATDPGTQVYYTLDGSDPRDSGGGVSPNAILYTSPISVQGTTPVFARARGGGDFFGGWSGPTSALFTVATPADASNLRVTELHYHPADPTPAELAAAPGSADNDYEFIELVNIGNEPISLNGVRFDDGIVFDFTNGAVATLGPGEAVVIVEDAVAFAARYGETPLVAGVYSGNLSNGGEDIALINADEQVIQGFSYSDDPPWPTDPDGGGPSLEVRDTAGDYNSPLNWRESVSTHGTPGVPTLFDPGDYDRNGVVEQADYTVWRTSFGSTVDLTADGNGNGIVDAGDYTIWRDHFEIAAFAVQTIAMIVAADDTSPTAADVARLATLPSEQIALASQQLQDRPSRSQEPSHPRVTDPRHAAIDNALAEHLLIRSQLPGQNETKPSVDARHRSENNIDRLGSDDLDEIDVSLSVWTDRFGRDFG